MYYISYVIGDDGFASNFFLIQIISYVAGTLISGKLVSIFKRKPTVLYSLIIGVFALVVQYFNTDNIMVILTCVTIFQISLAINFVIMWAMVADTVEYSEWKSKSRNEGIIYGYYNFIIRVAMGLGGALAGYVLQMYGYDTNNVTSIAINGINIGLTIIPAILFILGCACVTKYPMDEEKYKEIINKINNTPVEN